MAINYELINNGGISLGTNFELLSEKPLDSRLVVPSLDGLQNYIDSAAAYEGMVAYVSSEKKHYEVKVIDGVLSYRPFGLTETELNDLIINATTAAMEFKGATATLPENPSKGDMWKVAASFTVDEEEVKVGDSIVYNGEQWFVIPSGDDIEDTWRPVTDVANDATLTFTAGEKLDVAVASNGTITYSHETVAAPADITNAEAGDLNTRTYITAVETDGYGHITGYKTATENVEDTNTEYTFESQVESSSVYFNVTPDTEGATEQTVYVDAYSKNEVDAKLAGYQVKGDYKTIQEAIEAVETAANTFVDTVAQDANGVVTITTKSVDFTEVNDRIGDLETYVGTIPDVKDEDGNNKYADLDVIGYINKKAQETLNAASGNSTETAASVKQQLDDYIGENNTRVKAIEDAIDADPLHSHANKAELDKIADGDVAKWNAAEQNAKDYTDDEIEKLALGTMSKETADDYVKKSDATGYGDILTKTEAQDAYQPKGEYYTKTEADAAFTDSTEVDGQIDTKIAALDLANTYQAKGDYAAAEHDHVAADITDLDTTIKAYDYATNTEAQGYANAKDEAIAAAKKAGDDAQKTINDYKTANDAALALKADKSVVDAMYTNTKIDELIQGAKDYADANDANTEYGIVYDSDTKKIKLVSDTSKTEIDATEFIKDGMIETVALSEDGLNLVITWNTDSDKGEDNVTTIPLTGLVDVYTGVAGDRITVSVSSDDKISADLVANSISKNYLDEGVQASLALADSALQSHQDISHLATKDELESAKTEAANQDVVILAEAQAYAESKVNALAGNVYTQEEVDSAIEAAVADACSWGEF
jgi:hypothetical protein